MNNQNRTLGVVLNLDKPPAPADSWWATHPREGFTATAYAEWLTRMRFSKQSLLDATAKNWGKRKSEPGSFVLQGWDEE